MKKTLTVISFILLVPIMAAGFIIAIPARAFIEGYKVCSSLLDRGVI
jgi:hypothetical protein